MKFPGSNSLSVVKAGYSFGGAAAPCSGVQGMYKLHAAAFAHCILLPTIQNVGVKLLATLPIVETASKFMFWYHSAAKRLLKKSFSGDLQ